MQPASSRVARASPRAHRLGERSAPQCRTCKSKEQCYIGKHGTTRFRDRGWKQLNTELSCSGVSLPETRTSGLQIYNKMEVRVRETVKFGKKWKARAGGLISHSSNSGVPCRLLEPEVAPASCSYQVISARYLPFPFMLPERQRATMKSKSGPIRSQAHEQPTRCWSRRADLNR